MSPRNLRVQEDQDSYRSRQGITKQLGGWRKRISFSRYWPLPLQCSRMTGCPDGFEFAKQLDCPSLDTSMQRCSRRRTSSAKVIGW